MIRFVQDNTRFAIDNARWIGAGFLLTMFSSFGQTFFIGLSGNDIRESFDLSGGEFGALYMVATLASALTLPWLGRTLDIMPGWKVARFSILCLAGACLLLVLTSYVAVLTLAIFLLRLFGQGMMTEIALTETGRWFVANRGRAMALVVIGQQAGLALLPVCFVLVSNAYGWRMAWVWSAVLLLVLAFPVVVKLLSVERVPRTSDMPSGELRIARDWSRVQVMRDPMLYLALGGALAPAFIGTTIFFHQGYLIALRHYDPLVFAATFPVMAVTTVVFGLYCGHLIDRFGALRLLPFFLSPLAVASVVLAVIAPLWGVYVFMLLLGVSSGFTSTILGALWPEMYGTANLGGIRAIIVSAMVLSTAVGPGLTGLLIDHGIALPTQLLWMAGWCVIASFALGIVSRNVRRRNALADG